MHPLVSPEPGLIIWTLVIFILFITLLRRKAWKPILKAVHEREDKINNALDAAKEAEKKVAEMTATNEALLKEARNERDRMLKEARDTKDTMIGEAKTKAKEEGDRMIQIAREAIVNEKMAAISELKNQVAILSVEIAEKLIKEKLSDDKKQTQLIEDLIKEINL